MWHRGPDLKLALVNSAYVAAVEGTSAEDVVSRGVELIDAVEGRPPRATALAARDSGRIKTHVLDRLRAADIDRIVVNVHYLADALEAHLRRKASDLDVRISDERGILLETGGGVAKALPLIAEDSFLIANSDNLWIDGPRDAISLLAERWNEQEMDALLLLVPLARANCHSGLGDFHMAATCG